MIGSQPPIREEDLHAYVDGHLDPSRQSAMEQYLAATPEATERVAAYAAQREALRAAFGPRAAEPLPPELDLSRLIEARLDRRRPWWQLIAAGIALFIAGGAGGWLLYDTTFAGGKPTPIAVLEQQGFATHAVYATDRRHPIEVAASERDHLTQWLSNRLDRKVAPPDLAGFGYHLIGGRLVATERGGAAALFMYEDDAHARLSILVRPMTPGLVVPWIETSKGATTLCAWIENGLGYAVVAALPDAKMDQLYEYLYHATASTG